MSSFLVYSLSLIFFCLLLRRMGGLIKFPMTCWQADYVPSTIVIYFQLSRSVVRLHGPLMRGGTSNREAVCHLDRQLTDSRFGYHGKCSALPQYRWTWSVSQESIHHCLHHRWYITVNYVICIRLSKFYIYFFQTLLFRYSKIKASIFTKNIFLK